MRNTYPRRVQVSPAIRISMEHYFIANWQRSEFIESIQILKAGRGTLSKYHFNTEYSKILQYLFSLYCNFSAFDSTCTSFGAQHFFRQGIPLQHECRTGSLKYFLLQSSFSAVQRLKLLNIFPTFGSRMWLVSYPPWFNYWTYVVLGNMVVDVQSAWRWLLTTKHIYYYNKKQLDRQPIYVALRWKEKCHLRHEAPVTTHFE